MMSFEDGWQTSPYGNAATDVGYGYLGGLMAFDIAAIQDKYGVNEDWATGDDTYALKDVNAAGTYYSSIWDAGGHDRITYDGDRDAAIDLRPATLQHEYGGGGFVSYADGVFGGFTIADGVTIEGARAGSDDDVLVGNAARNVLDGGAGADVLDGGAGNDRLLGHAGRDTASYLLADRGVRVDLGAEGGQATHAGRDTLVSVENLTRSHHDDRLTGDGGRNDLFGADGDDVLSGGDGADLLTGGAGIDRLTGGAGADTFAFANGEVGATTETADRILDFAARDRIDLSGIDAVASTVDADEAFTFIGDAAFGKVAGELQLVTRADHFQLSGDTDGDGIADFVIIGRGPAPVPDAIVL